MSTSKATIPLLLVLLGTLGYIFFTRQELNSERAKRQQLTQDSIALAEQLSGYTRLASADSVFHAGRYAPARAAYEALLASDSLTALVADLPERIRHAQRLLNWRYQLDTLQRRVLSAAQSPAALLPPPAASAPTVPVPVRSLGVRPATYDSLKLVLRQAEGEVRALRAQIRQTTGPNYLTFRSKEGNKTYYVGEIANGKANGRGVALLSTGSRYEGEWKDNQKHGTGEFNWSDGARYEGTYVNDKRSGQGAYYFPDGGVYTGGWKEGLRDGEGVFKNAKGKVVAKGIWRKDELVE